MAASRFQGKDRTWDITQAVALLFYTVFAILAMYDFIYLVIAVCLLPFNFLALASLISNIKMDTVKSRVFVSWNILNIALLAVSCIDTSECFAYDMQRHYEEKAADFQRITDYITDKIPPSTYFRYDIEEEEILFMRPDTLCITRRDLDTLRTMLEQVGCFEITAHNDSLALSYARAGWGAYSYIIYNRGLTHADSVALQANMSNIMYRDGVVFNYGPGVVGDYYFPRREEYRVDTGN